MITFLLNNERIDTNVPTGTTLLDFIRYHQNKKGTKIGCREGDCGACTVMVGSLNNEDEMQYESVTSCLMPIGNAHLKHIVTIEGLHDKEPSAVQKAFYEANATQCGFCTPGFIMALTTGCVNGKASSSQGAIDSMNGNICRCTGYQSIKKAATEVCQQVQECSDGNYLQHSIQHQIVPSYFKHVKSRLKDLAASALDIEKFVINGRRVAGGTDIYVQQHESVSHESPSLLSLKSKDRYIKMDGDNCTFGYATTVADIAQHPFFQRIQNWNDHIKLVSSTQIRNMATVAGNFVNASPIGDFSIIFLALDAQLKLDEGELKRDVPLRKFFLQYKVVDLHPREHIDSISFNYPSSLKFSFEKVSKRTHLDIASVNSALAVEMDVDVIRRFSLSAGGVGPVPLFLKNASTFMEGKTLNQETISKLMNLIQEDISPISDARGTSDYKRLLLSQLVKAHLLKIFPGIEI